MLARLSLLSTAALLAVSMPALAADAPSMIGTWTGTVDSAVMVGNSPYRTAESDKKITFNNEPLSFTFNITEQQGARFGGTLTSDTRSETLIGHVSADNSSGIMLDDDGRYSFTLAGAGTMEVCYDHSKPDSKVIACWTATRTK